ncbi:MAG TPA: transcriptional regulator [Microscillaceae bacterium]|nr:transcriptional regulator [Microscillaceae bacterium]
MIQNIEIRHLRYFMTVAEELHFRKAAERLYISQPGLSRQIRQMEEDLGVQLFERNNRKVQLTPAGQYLKKEVSVLLKNLEKAFEHTQLMEKGQEGSIKLGYVGSAMQNVIPELLIKFREVHPTILFNLTEMDNARQVQALLHKEIDIGFVRLNQVPENLQLHPVLHDTFSLVLPQNHPLDVNNFHSLTQLKQESFILFEKNFSPVYFERVMSVFEQAGFNPNISHYTVHANTIFKLVENQFGVAIVPTSLKEGYDMRVKFIELADIPARTVLSAVWNSQNRNPVLEKMLGILMECVK